MISENFGLDDIDRSIITLLQKHPNITHSEIAKRIGRSQPAVGSRIHRLEEKGVISSQYGINFKNADIILAKVELSTSDPDDIIEMGKYCPFVVNCMRLSGKNNILLLLASSSMKKIDNVVDCHFRNHEHIRNVRLDIITGFVKDFILPIDFEMENHDPDPIEGCGDNCARKIALEAAREKAKS
ncbi:MAG: Lrp/AsnC family transcriptional regulator [Candidatus Lokiarchaeota archaeon]|nr:Lrp/AsnC family transcriptional regulator [Candidatus Lokiarchaeota archaeon]